MPAAADRFWAKVDRRSPEECWPWKAGIHRGYGLFRAEKDRPMVRAHRYSWALANGPIPEGMNVLHRCDNPPCCNPAHLFLGTQLDNVEDCAAKGRRRPPSGENNGRAKLTAELVDQIRTEYRPGLQQALANKYGVSRATVSRVLRRAGWSNPS
jgi:hypothetical protein